MERTVKNFIMSQVLFGKTFNYMMEATFEPRDNGLAIISLTGTCIQTNVTVDFLPMFENDKGIMTHVIQCLQANWKDLDTVEFYTDELHLQRLKRANGA